MGRFCPFTGKEMPEIPVKTLEDVIRQTAEEAKTNPHLDMEMFIPTQVGKISSILKANQKRATWRRGGWALALTIIGTALHFAAIPVLMWAGRVTDPEKKTLPPQNPKPAISRPAIPPPPAP